MKIIEKNDLKSVNGGGLYSLAKKAYKTYKRWKKTAATTAGISGSTPKKEKDND